MIYKNIFIIIIFSIFLYPIYNKTGFLINYDFSNPLQFKLKNELKEISGMATNEKGEVFAHNDEEGFIYKLNPENGNIIKRFYLGKEKVLNDFEGLAIEGVNFYLISSGGELYHFFEQPDGKYSSYKKTNVGIDASYNIEGLCIDPETFSLLIACKENKGKQYANSKIVYSYSLSKRVLDPEPRFIISMDKLKSSLDISYFSPSSIVRNDKSNTFFILSAKENALIEISKKGELLTGIKLPKKLHKKPESIAFDNNDNLIIGDEGNKKNNATLTKYTFK